MEYTVNFDIGSSLEILYGFMALYITLTLYGYYYIINNFKAVARLYSTVHAALAVVFALAYLSTLDTAIYQLLVCNSIAYCLYDSIVITQLPPLDPLMIIHHLAFIGGLVYFYQVYPYYVALGLLMETSSIFLNWSWYLHKTKQTHTNTFRNVAAALIISYALCRILLLCYFLYDMLFVLHCMSCSLFSTGLLTLNGYWFTLLLYKATTTPVVGAVTTTPVVGAVTTTPVVGAVTTQNL